MRATNAGKRRSAAKQPKAPIERKPRPRATSQYETHVAFPGLHVATVARSHRYEGVDGPTVESFVADGYHEIEPGDSGILVPPNHALMAIPVSEFEDRERERHDFGEELLNPPDQPQTAEDIQNIIAGRLQGGNSGFGTISNLKTKPPVSLAEAQATLRQVELNEAAKLQFLRETGAAAEE